MRLYLQLFAPATGPWAWFLPRIAAAAACGLALCTAATSAAVSTPASAPAEEAAAPAAEPTYAEPTYADLADLVTGAALVAKVVPRKAIVVEPERAPGLAPGHARIYVEGRTQALLAGAGLHEQVRYLVDVRRDARGKLPKLKGKPVLLFAHPPVGQAGELRLISATAQLDWSEAVDARVRALLGEVLAPGAPPAVTGIREAMFVPGNLAGEGESQIFLDSAGGTPVTLNVVHRPGAPPRWGVSWSEIVHAHAAPPPRDSLGWYRLACFPPDELPPEALLGQDATARAAVSADYRLIREQLGPCPRLRG